MVSGSYRLSVEKSVNEATRSGRSCRICSWYARRPMLKLPPVCKQKYDDNKEMPTLEELLQLCEEPPL
eukprot:scaffold236141_cov70-Attheya_sp.AAC.1